MTDVLMFLKENPYAWGIFLFLSILLAFIGIIQNIKKKQLLYIVETNFIIEKSNAAIEDLSISYGNEPIQNLIISKVALINSGNITILNEDIPKAASLEIIAGDDSQILSASLLAESNDSSLCNIKQNSPSAATIGFDYLNKRDGAVFQIIHTGNSSILDYSGKIKGGKIILPNRFLARNTPEWFPFSIFSLYVNMFYMSTALLVLIAVLGVLAIFRVPFIGISLDSNAGVHTAMEEFWIPLFVATLAGLMGWFISYSQFKKSKFILPKSLRKYFR